MKYREIAKQIIHHKLGELASEDLSDYGRMFGDEKPFTPNQSNRVANFIQIEADKLGEKLIARGVKIVDGNR